MGFVLMCIYIFLSFVRILDLYPGYEDLRTMLILGQLCLVSSFIEWGLSRRKKRASLKEVQIWLTVLFFVLAIFGWARIGWWDEMTDAFNHLNIIFGGFVMVVINLT